MSADDELLAAWMDYWWGTPTPGQAIAAEAVPIAANALADFRAHLDDHGFAIVRRLSTSPQLKSPA